MTNAKDPKALPYMASAMALATGLAIAWMDTRPGWDDAGITAGSMALASALASASGARPWLVVLLVSGPLIAAEFGGGPAIVLTALFAAFGSAVGWGLRRAWLAGAATR